jgi:putative endonuclease
VDLGFRLVSFKRQELGARGEQIAAEHLEALGWRVLERRWRCAVGELDLVAEDGETVVFVEVRTRSPNAKVPARQSVGFGKQRRVARAALHYVRARNLRLRRFRFDVLAIALGPEGSQVEHFRAAFELPRDYW